MLHVIYMTNSHNQNIYTLNSNFPRQIFIICNIFVSALICISEPIISYYTHHTAAVITSVYCTDMKKLCNYSSMKMFLLSSALSFVINLLCLREAVSQFVSSVKNICNDDCSGKVILRNVDIISVTMESLSSSLA